MTQSAHGSVPWQLTGNHWLSLPCIHPADGAVHALGLIHRGARAAVEFSGGADFLAGRAAPLIRPTVAVDGTPLQLSGQAMAWERASHWLPTFTCGAGDLVIRGTVFAPFGRDVDIAGAVYALSVENRGSQSRTITLGVDGTLGHRQLRVRTPRAIDSRHLVSLAGPDAVVLEGDDAPGFATLAITGDGGSEATVTGQRYAVTRAIEVAPGQRAEAGFYLGAGPERDGALATVDVLRSRGWKATLAGTRTALRTIEQSSGIDAVDALVNRHLVFAYFYAVGRALDDAHYYLMRSRAPWSTRGLTIRDWEALMWTVPAVQLADTPLARELILRACEIHGYAPGRGTNYIDGTLFSPGFTLEGAASYAIAADRYIQDTGDDQIVEEVVLADTLYLSSDDISDRRDEHFPLYRADVTLGGAASRGFSLHANAAVAHALDCLKRTLDEGEADKLQNPDDVRAAIKRHFAAGEQGKSVYASWTNPGEFADVADDPSASALWLPTLDAIDRSDATWKRTAKAVTANPELLEARLAHLVTQDGAATLEWLRRAELDGGLAAERVDAAGHAADGGADAALSGLLAATVWHVVHEYGIRP